LPRRHAGNRLEDAMEMNGLNRHGEARGIGIARRSINR
jgi:hypothetical protein